MRKQLKTIGACTTVGTAATAAATITTAVAAIGATAIGLAGCATDGTPVTHTAVSEADLAEQRAFLNTLSQFCGDRFEGESVYADPDADSQLDGAELVMHVETCEPDEFRIPLRVDDDESRTWVITMTDNGLHLRHDHRDPDGTPHERTDYGGYAAPGGTAHRQSFPADDFTKQLIPEASTNVWTLEVDLDEMTFIYDLQRHGEPRFRGDFDLSEPYDPY